MCVPVLTSPIVREIGRGDHSRVYHVQNPSKSYACKFFENKSDFNKEVAVLSYIQSQGGHSNIIHYFGSLKNKIGGFGLCLELAAANLSYYLKHHKHGLRESLTIKFTHQIATALLFLQEKEVIHGNLTPSNILISLDEKKVMISDFGSASKGKLPPKYDLQLDYYKSPEVILELDYTAAADMWSLACVTTEMITGWTLFKNGVMNKTDLITTQEHILRGNYPEELVNQASFQHQALVIASRRWTREDLHCIDELVPKSLLTVIKRMFDFTPTTRLTPQELINQCLILENPPNLLATETTDKFLGMGAFGKVYLIRRPEGNCALKVIEEKSNFTNEHSIMSYIQSQGGHPNIVRYMGSIEKENGPGMLLELASKSLDAYLKQRRKGFSEGSAIKITHQIAEALLFLQEKEIIHGDIKPGNILMSLDGKKVMITDFGSAVRGKTSSIYNEGTLNYASPEAFLKVEYTAATDMWSLACIVVEMITKKPLFAGEDEWDIFGEEDDLIMRHEHILNGTYPDELVEKASPELQELVAASRESEFTEEVPLLYELVPHSLLGVLMRMFDFSPNTRLTPQELINWRSTPRLKRPFSEIS